LVRVEVLSNIEERVASEAEAGSGGRVDILATDGFDDLDWKVKDIAFFGRQ